ncbi:MAG: rhomboid family intramembrane serine protease [Bdellovibrio sp.]|nr:rhomboid family intramembrane serine protease [Bdellovibrio sp.]
MPLFMINNFLISWTALTEGRVWTLITSVFSHNLLWHLFINMYVFFGFGSVLEKLLGFKKFFKFYLIAGIFSSLSHALVCALILHRPEIPALGASGAISAIVIVFALLFPKEKIYLFGLIPIPALSGALTLSALDLWGLISQAKGHELPIGYGAHLGGVAFGIIYYFFQRHRSKAGVFST